MYLQCLPSCKTWSTFLVQPSLPHYLARALMHHRYLSTLFCFQLPSWAGNVHFCPPFNVVFLPLLLSTSFSFFLSLCPVDSSFLKQKTFRRGQITLVSGFLTRVRSSSYSPMAAWIFLWTSLLVIWPFSKWSTAFGSFSSQRPVFLSVLLLHASGFNIHRLAFMKQGPVVQN